MAGLGVNMTLKEDIYYGGYEKLTVGVIGNSNPPKSMAQLSPLSKRFIRFIAKRYMDTIVLPRATDLPLTPGGPIFTLWNEGHNNCQLKKYGGDQYVGTDDLLVGCIQGYGTSGVPKCWTNVYLLDNSTDEGVWRIDCGECDSNQPGNVTSTWSETGEGGDTETETATDEPTMPGSVGEIRTAPPLPPKPLPFPRHPRHPEIPIPVPHRRPQRAAEGI